MLIIGLILGIVIGVTGGTFLSDQIKSCLIEFFSKILK